jgi:hypothetical protein
VLEEEERAARQPGEHRRGAVHTPGAERRRLGPAVDRRPAELRAADRTLGEHPARHPAADQSSDRLAADQSLVERLAEHPVADQNLVGQPAVARRRRQKEVQRRASCPSIEGGERRPVRRPVVLLEGRTQVGERRAERPLAVHPRLEPPALAPSARSS